MRITEKEFNNNHINGWIVDPRQEYLIKAVFYKMGIPFTEELLPYGDLKNDDLVMERATVADLDAKVDDGRLYSQGGRMADGTELIPFFGVTGTLDDVKCPKCKTVIIKGINPQYRKIKGKKKRVYVSKKKLLGAIASIIVRTGVPVIWMLTEEDLVKVALKIKEKLDEGKGGKPEINHLRNKYRHRDRRIILLRVAYGLSEVAAKNLLSHYGSLKWIFGLQEEDVPEIVQCVRGVAKTLAERIIKINSDEKLK